ncbi:50S ribosomal protein L25/general stress protein Ctc [Deinococcus maricopensis]|uniref:Large ribosomal subunit protein bL25 n=1 Tax=Deinococcus maricopensis (strain DSM 21211 / LMG 22137 / NRRL B-23946 / LB-34) TaxID=709986 RepID=E8UBB0_DEIML|nr:50S ribosomal protein L25/general stress protein Ctc [Deinococcus maricopensis]ADV68349.1 50S ribosomal protein L25 [Deinococcus maricopensis DSM 21211]
MELKAIARTGQEKLSEGYMPAVAYHQGTNVMFAIERKAFDRAFRQQGKTGLFDIAIEGGETFPALVKAVQMDKRKREAIHADFLMVTYGEPVQVDVPVHTTGKSQGEIMGGLVDVVVHNLSVIAPGPRRIPTEIAVDVTKLNIGDHVKAGDIALPDGVKLASDADLTVISVLPPRLSEGEAAAEQQAAQVAGLVAAGEISAEAAEAVLEGDATLEDVKPTSEETAAE